MQVEVRIQGIPAIANLLGYSPAQRPTYWEPGYDEEFEFELLDRKGYPAAWLERKMTSEDEEAVYEAFRKAADDCY